MSFSSQLTALREKNASAKTLQDTIQALEQDKAHLQERLQRLEKDHAAGPDAISKSLGNNGLNL